MSYDKVTLGLWAVLFALIVALLASSALGQTTVGSRAIGIGILNRSIRFVCNQQTLPNDIASCMNRAVRLYFEGDWRGVDLCDKTGEHCTDIGTLLTPNDKK